MTFLRTPSLGVFVRREVVGEACRTAVSRFGVSIAGQHAGSECGVPELLGVGGAAASAPQKYQPLMMLFPSLG